MNRDLRNEKTPVAYFHPWEFDPEQKRMETGWLDAFIANFNSGTIWDRFVDLVTRYRTSALVDVLDAVESRC